MQRVRVKLSDESRPAARINRIRCGNFHARKHRHERLVVSIIESADHIDNMSVSPARLLEALYLSVFPGGLHAGYETTRGLFDRQLILAVKSPHSYQDATFWDGAM